MYADEPVNQILADGSPDREARRGPVKILLVDDNPDNLIALEAILAGPDYDLVMARSGQEALRLLLKDEYAVVLLDVVMPGMDGFEVAGLIREREATSHLPIVFLTALATDVHHIYRGYAVGAVDYLQKPLDANMVRAKVLTFVELHRKNRQIQEHAQQLRELERTQYQLREAQLLREQELMQLAYEQAAHAEAVASELRATFLAEVSRLLASSLELDQLLPSLARFIVAGLGDWCVLDLRHDDALVPQIAVHRHADRQALLDGLVRYPGRDRGEAWGLRTVLRDGVAVAGKVEPAELAAWIGTADVDTVALLGSRSYLCLPLVTQGEVLGVMTVVADDPQRFGPMDMALATDIGHRIALALHNAALYRQAQAAIRTRDEFMSIASHELKTPLTTLSLQVHLLRRSTERAVEHGEPLSPAVFLKGLRDMDRENHRLCMLIDRLLDLTRLDSNGLELTLSPMNFHDLVLEAVDRHGPQIVFEGDPGTEGYWDRLRLEQVVTNLLSNALKYGGGKPVTVTLALDDSQAVLTVQDQGIGIAPDKQERIFERFGRAVTEREFGGIGLGLYITRQIVEAHGGRIAVSSVSGGGSTFTVTLPVAPLTPVAIPPGD
jgi:signal transduction histidine kinase/DNA-binding response OmpR family regulator